MKKGISIVLLAYKEAENLKILLPQIIENIELTGEAYEILVIDTAKPLDNTNEVCANFGATYINQDEPGFAGAFRTGIRYAAMDKFLIMDSDGSHNPKYIPDIYHKYIDGGYDLVIGSRYVNGGKTNDKKSSIFMSKILNTVFRISLGIKANDLSTDFRMYNTQQLKTISLQCKNYDVLEEVLLKLKLQKENGISGSDTSNSGKSSRRTTAEEKEVKKSRQEMAATSNGDNTFRIGETPINFDKRMYGESKRRLIPFIISYGKTLLSLISMRLRYSETFRNLVLYGIFGVLAAILEYTVFGVLVHVTNIQAEVVNVIGALCGFAFTFTTNTFLNFKKTDNIFKRFISYGSICLAGIAVSTLLIAVFKNIMNLMVLKLLCMIFVSVMQFIFNKMFTYKNFEK